MTFHCTHEGCFPDTTCALGHLNREECEHWKDSKAVPGSEDGAIEAETSDIPWNGYSLGTSDLAILGGRGRPAVVGMVGPPDSGKTSLLAFLYMWLLKHGRIGKWLFAGSWTLGGWESVVQCSRWTGEPPPSFPPHTSSAGRHPGILHLGLRCTKSGQLQDVMFTDAPGEWFTQWSRVPEGTNSAGARWVVEHADSLLLLVDSGALAEPDKLPGTRRATRDLIDRVAAYASCPVSVVWTKNDIEVPQPAERPIQSACNDFLPAATVLRTSVKEPETIEGCFNSSLAAATSGVMLSSVKEHRLSHDPFLAYRGIHVGT